MQSKFSNILVKGYWIEIAVFGFIFAVLMVDLTPDFTFMNKSSDSIEFIFGAKYFYTTHQMSVPLYLLLGHFFLMIPFGTDAWRMGIISVLSSMGTCVFIYLILRNALRIYPHAKFYAILGVLLFGTSALVISQSSIVQTYPLLTLFITGAYYFAKSSRWLLMAIMLGLGFAVHPLMAVFLIIFMIFYKEYRGNWTLILTTLSFSLFYLYLAFANKNPDLESEGGLLGSILNLIAVVNYFVGTTSIFELPKRILDTVGVVGISVGVIAIIPIVYYFVHTKYYRDILFWLAVTPILLYISNLDMQTFDYMLMAMPFLAILTAIGACKFLVTHGRQTLKYAYAGCAILIGFGLFNGYYFDIGNHIDRDLSISKLYNDLDQIPSDAKLISFNLSLVSLYNKDHDTDIYLLEVEKLDRLEYVSRIQTDGIRVSHSTNKHEVARSIIALNDNVWYAKLVDPMTYGYQVVEANHNSDLIPSAILASHLWGLSPSNPYDILTTRIFLTEWQSAIMSKLNFRILCLILIGVGYLAYKVRANISESKQRKANAVKAQ